MRLVLHFILPAALAFAAGAAPAWAEPEPAPPDAPRTRNLGKGGPELKIMPVVEDYPGVLYGVRSLGYMSPSSYWGILAFGSLPLIGKDLAPSINTIGLLGGYEGRLPHRLSYDMNLHVGWTRSSSDAFVSPLGNQLSIEPSVAVGVPLPYLRGTRLSLCAGYMVLPFAFASSMPTLGLRIETKVFSVTVAVDD